MSCTCSLCYRREYGWHKWYAKYRNVWSLELNTHPIERLGRLYWVWMNDPKKCPYNFTELETHYQRQKGMK